MIRIYGTMTDPSGSPVPGAIIELRAISSTNEVLLGSTVTIKCDQQGAYSFQLAAGMYDAYAQNDRCGDMDYLGTAKVSANSVDGDLHSILVDGGINITPPMLDGALAAAQRAELAAGISEANKVSTEQNAESAKTDSAAAKTARGEAVSAAGTAVSAKDCIVSDAIDVRSLAVQVAAQSSDVSIKHGDVVAKAEQVSAQADVVSTKHDEVVTKAAQASDDVAATQSAKNISVAAADTAAQKAASAATHDASAKDAAARAENAASVVVGAVLDGGECDLSSGVYPQPITVAGKKYSTIWYVAVSGSVSGVTFDVGDLLRYTTARDGYYFKVDAKDDVYSVNGEKGPVTVTPEKIGAEKTGVAQQLVEQHASKHGAHAISSVQGLAEALAGKETAGAALSAVTAHEEKAGAHSIADVAGLQEKLDALENEGGKPVLSTEWVSKRTAMWNGFGPADGQTLSRALYPDAFAAIQAGLVPVCSDADWLADPAKRGYYTLGDGSTTFRVPDYNGVQSGSYGPVYLGGGGTGGTILRDRIQNFTGSFQFDTNNGYATNSGVFKRTTGVARNWLGTAASVSSQLIEIDLASQIRVGDTTRPITVEGCLAVKLFGAVQNAGSADAAELATAVAGLASRVTLLEARKSTCLVHEVGTGSGATHETVSANLPANVIPNREYILTNPFGADVPVIVKAQIFYDGKWADAGWDGNFGASETSASVGVAAKQRSGVGIIVQTGINGVDAGRASVGSGTGNAGVIVTSAACRVFVLRLD